MTEIPIRISPQAEMLPANTLRFYIHFPKPGEAHFDRDQLWLGNEEEQVVQDPFFVLSQELWSLDGRRLTVLMEPGRIKRGLGADPAHDPALVVGRTYSLVVTALGQTARYTFRVGDPVLEEIKETSWRLTSPTVATLEPAVVRFDRRLPGVSAPARGRSRDANPKARELVAWRPGIKGEGKLWIVRLR